MQTAPHPSPSAGTTSTHSPAPDVARQVAQRFVRHDAESLAALSDADLQDYITDTSGAFLAAHCRYLKSSCLADKGERDGLELAQREALLERGRRGHLVAAMERKLGLS